MYMIPAIDTATTHWDDDTFDDQLPAHLHTKSSVHFTPVAVAQFAVRLLAPTPGTRVLDVGSGAGKFCLVAAQAQPATRFVGVEYRERLVTVAAELAARNGLANVEFVHADAFNLDWADFDAFYFFNPFGEQLHHGYWFLDLTIEFCPANYVKWVSAVRERLGQARIGTRVVTYHGFGGPAPMGYAMISEHTYGSDRLELWVKMRPTYSIMADELTDEPADELGQPP